MDFLAYLAFKTAKKVKISKNVNENPLITVNNGTLPYASKVPPENNPPGDNETNKKKAIQK